MLKTLSQIIWHFIFARPDKILITIILPLLMLGTWDYRNNIKEYKDFIFDNYIWIIPIVIIYNGILAYRSKCVKRENESCKNPEIRHEILKATNFLSFFEIQAIMWLMIINIGIKRDAK
jgi:hypothetical protein